MLFEQRGAFIKKEKETKGEYFKSKIPVRIS